MPPLSHFSYPSLLFVLIAFLLNIDYSFSHLLVLAFGSIFPDLDLFFFSLIKKRKRRFSPLDFITLIFVAIIPGSRFFIKGFTKEERFQKPFGHRSWPTHLPVFYFPLLFLYVGESWPWLGLFCFGVFSHLALDTTNQKGIGWGWPLFKKRISLFGKKEKEEEREGSGLDFFRNYKKTARYRLDLLASLIVVFSMLASLLEAPPF